MDRTPKEGEIYRHFKNKLYRIVAIAEHTENQEKLVIYQALYGDFAIYARPLDMFTGKVDHEKYPQVEQTYRFELVNAEELVGAEDLGEMQNAAKDTVDAEETGSDNEQTAVSKKLMEFLDADTMEEKYNILVSMRDEITDQMIDNMAVVVDVVIPEGELYNRYDELKNAIRTRQKYEYANRLR